MATILHTDGRTEDLTLEGSPAAQFKQLQQAIGGYVQVITGGLDGQVMVFDEEASFKKGATVNSAASVLLQSWSPDRQTVDLVGTVVVLEAAEAKAVQLTR